MTTALVVFLVPLSAGQIVAPPVSVRPFTPPVVVPNLGGSLNPGLRSPSLDANLRPSLPVTSTPNLSAPEAPLATATHESNPAAFDGTTTVVVPPPPSEVHEAPPDGGGDEDDDKKPDAIASQPTSGWTRTIVLAALGAVVLWLLCRPRDA